MAHTCVADKIQPDASSRTIRVFVAEDHQITMWGLRRLIDAVGSQNSKRKSRSDEMKKRHAKWAKKLAKLDKQSAIVEAIRSLAHRDVLPSAKEGDSAASTAPRKSGVA